MARRRIKIDMDKGPEGEISELGFHPVSGSGWNAVVCVSAEHGDDAADYYGEFRGGHAWINPKLERWALDRGLFWEWINPGLIAAYE